MRRKTTIRKVQAKRGPRARPGTAGLWWATAEWAIERMGLWAFLREQVERQTKAWCKDLSDGKGGLAARCRRVSASMARFARRTQSEFDASMARSLSHALSDSPKTGNPRLRRT